MRVGRVLILLLVLATLLPLASPAQSAARSPVLVHDDDRPSSSTAERGKGLGEVVILSTGVYSGTLAPIAARVGTSMLAVLDSTKLRHSVVLSSQRLWTPGGNASPTPPPSAGKWIDVDLSSQTTTAYRGNAPQKIVLVSTGTAWRQTPTGSFKIYLKVPSQTLSGGVGADRYSFTGVPWIMYFSGEVGFHGAYWHNNFGVPMSHGCVNLSVEDAKWFYNWSTVGMPVVVHP